MFYIYRITNKINGKTYIGKHKYKKLDDNYMGSGINIRRAQKKYGIENFEKKILVFNISKLEQVNLLEKTFIDAEREKVGRENCYNIADGGQGGALCKGKTPWNKGKHHSEETKRKISESKNGCSAWNKGKHLSEEQKKHLSEINTGSNSPNYGRHYKHSEETKQKISEMMRGKPAHNKGKSMSEEQKRKQSEAMKGHKVSEETRKKMSEAHKGRTSFWKGKHISEETKRKIAESKKGKHWKLVDGKRVFY